MKRKKKAWSVTARYPYVSISTVVYAATLPKAFRRYSRKWHMDDLLEISITEVKSDERSEGVSGADQVV